jgi:protein O-GlcNAc transferase
MAQASHHWLALAQHYYRAGDWTRLRSVLEQAHQANPGHWETLSQLAGCYHQAREFDRAAALLQNVLAREPQHQQALRQLSTILNDAGRIQEACGCLERLLALDPRDAPALFQLVIGRRKCCDWREYDELAERMRRESEVRLPAGEAPVETPLVALCIFSDNAYLYRIARAWADNRRKRHNRPYLHSPAPHLARSQRITIGYVTDELRDHPIGLLMHDYFQYHDRQRFRVIAYFDQPPDEQDRVFQFIRSTCEESRQVAGVDHASLAAAIHADGVDILVDLKGWREPNRLAVFALRPAPIAVAFQGFAGTTGADYLDYLIADDCVVPRDQTAFYAEKLAYLGRSYQVNPDHQPAYEELHARAGSRQNHGLPDDGIVLASFNQAYKLDPQLMGVWLEILRQCEGTVLWLLEMNEDARRNLRTTAAASGIDPQRLVFAPWADHELHLARLTHADLGLDTRVYNGHTTTSEAVWCRVPVVTLLGSHFASRVSASILREVGLDELITGDLAQYRELALQLIRDPQRRARIRDRLTAEYLRETLFNTRDFVRRTEDLFEQMFARYQSGLPAEMLDCRVT